VDGDRHATAEHREVDVGDAAVTVDSGQCVVFLTNRATTSATEVQLDIRGARFTVEDAWTVTTPDGLTRHAVNTADSQPVRPIPLPDVTSGDTITATLPPLSWTALRLVDRDA
ncbi:alpha-L-arabinofuranosidase, partial [Kibdelosporangium lantanae]